MMLFLRVLNHIMSKVPLFTYTNHHESLTVLYEGMSFRILALVSLSVVSLGVVSLGAVSLSVVSLGAVSLGAVSLLF